MKLQDRALTQTVDFQPWPHLIDLLQKLVNHQLLIILKARQLGISWLLCAYCTWKAKFFDNAKVLMLSQGEEEAFDLISKCRFIDNNLPDFLRGKRDPDQRGHIGFPDVGSEILALPSTEKAGRSTDATIIVCDEWEFHPYAEANFAALKPTIDAGGQFIGLSTADKTKMNTFFKDRYHKAMNNEGGFVKVFLPWNVRPGRDEPWFKQATADLRSWQTEQEYPSIEKEALGTLKTVPFFDQDILEEMKTTLIKPIRHELSDKHKTVKIYKDRVVGHKYVLFTDPSDGKEDPHASVVKDVKTGEWVAVSHGKVTADYVALIHDELTRYYFNAFNSWELIGPGLLVADKLKEMRTPNISPFIKPDGTLDRTKVGWWPGKTLRNKMLLEHEEAIRKHYDRIYDLNAINEHMMFMRPEGEEPQAPRGAHDDFIIAGAGTNQLVKYVPLGEASAANYKYRT